MGIDRRGAFFLGAGCLAFVTVAVAVRATVPLTNSMLGALIVIVGFLPGVRYLRAPLDAREPLPLVPLIGVFYAAFFGLSIFFLPALVRTDGRLDVYANRSLDVPVAWPVTLAQIAVLVGLGLFYVGGTMGRRAAKASRLTFRLPTGHDRSEIRFALWGLTAAYLAYLYVPALRSVPSAGQFLQPAVFVMASAFYLLWTERRLNRTETAILIAAVLPLVLVGQIKELFFTPVIMLAVFFLAARLRANRPIPWKALIAAALAVYVLYQPMQRVRSYIWSESAGHSVTTKIGNAAHLVYDHFTTSGISAYAVHPYLAKRITLIVVLAEVIESTPGRVPFWAAETYRPLLTALVPRVFWKDKPREETGSAFGRRYGMLHEIDRNISINLPWLTELFANFGWFGVAVGMAMFGILLGALNAFMVRRDSSTIEYAVGAAMVLPLFYQESNFSLMIGTVPMQVLAFYLYFSGFTWAAGMARNACGRSNSL